MRKKFNITGSCVPERHYMADISKKLESIMQLVEDGAYFTINRPRQYGKTTTLFHLSKILLQRDFIPLQISFEGMGKEEFENAKNFCNVFLKKLGTSLHNYGKVELVPFVQENSREVISLSDLADFIIKLALTAQKRLVLLIDEVDKSTNNQLFLDFLGILRDKYLNQLNGFDHSFYSVILVGVHDVKTLKLKIRPNEEEKYNSPWNIAAEFNVDMSLQVEEMIPMLKEYSTDSNVKMDPKAIAEALFYYTSGYPFLVSKLCKILDEKLLPKASTWSEKDVENAVKQLIIEKNTNFDNILKYLENDPNLYQLVYHAAIDNISLPFNSNVPGVELGVLYGIFTNRNGLAIHNRIFQEVLVDYMSFDLLLNRVTKSDMGGGYKSADGKLNMQAVLLGFQAFMKKEYSKKDRDFLERNGRLIFLAFIKPIINGSGHDFKEPQISEERRLDVVITYFQHKYVAELKIWRGKVAHQTGLQQLCDYLDRQNLDEGYLVIFDHQEVKTWATDHYEINGKRIMAVWV
jgi:hypothetical protein